MFGILKFQEVFNLLGWGLFSPFKSEFLLLMLLQVIPPFILVFINLLKETPFEVLWYEVWSYNGGFKTTSIVFPSNLTQD